MFISSYCSFSGLNQRAMNEPRLKKLQVDLCLMIRVSFSKLLKDFFSFLVFTRAQGKSAVKSAGKKLADDFEREDTNSTF